MLGLDDLHFRCSDIRNAGVIRYKCEYLLLLTIEMLEGRCAIVLAHSSDGLEYAVETEPFMSPYDIGVGMYENGGISNARVTAFNGHYYITYVADSDHGQRIGLAKTENFRSVERLGYISQVDVKNGVLFPRKIDGQYVLLKRPNDGGRIWISYSDDLEFWRSERVVMTPRGGFWDSHRIGASASPIEIDEGWLLIYYGVKDTSAGPLVRLGAAILDRDDPSKVIARSNIPILSPRESYERIGDVPNVVFSCGALLEDGVVEVFYGASDSCICRGTAPLAKIVATCFENEKEFLPCCK